MLQLFKALCKGTSIPPELTKVPIFNWNFSSISLLRPRSLHRGQSSPTLMMQELHLRRFGLWHGVHMCSGCSTLRFWYHSLIFASALHLCLCIYHVTQLPGCTAGSEGSYTQYSCHEKDLFLRTANDTSNFWDVCCIIFWDQGRASTCFLALGWAEWKSSFYHEAASNQNFQIWVSQAQVCNTHKIYERKGRSGGVDVSNYCQRWNRRRCSVWRLELDSKPWLLLLQRHCICACKR